MPQQDAIEISMEDESSVYIRQENSHGETDAVIVDILNLAVFIDSLQALLDEYDKTIAPVYPPNPRGQDESEAAA